MAPLIFWRAHAIISVSKKAIYKLKKETKKEIIYLPNGVDLETFKPCDNYKYKKYVCYVGRLDKDKGIERLINEVDDPLLIIGKDEGIKPDLIKIAYKKKRKIIFKEINFKKMPKAYCECRYVILPSRYEGFPLTMLEAIACQRPFLATDVGDIKLVLTYLFGDKGRKFIIKENIQKSISELEKEDLRILLKKARAKIRKKYSWKKISNDVLKIYKKVKN